MNTDLFSSSSEDSVSECSEVSEWKLFPEDMALSEIVAHGMRKLSLSFSSSDAHVFRPLFRSPRAG